MGRIAKPWYWPERKGYYAHVRGRRLRLAADERTAKQKLKELLQQPIEEVFEGNTLAKLFSTFLKHVEANKSADTHAWYSKHLNALSGAFPDISAEEIDTSDIQTWLDAKTTWSDGTKHGAWRAIYRAFKWGVKQKYCSGNPAADVEKPAPTNRDVTVTKAEYKKMLSLCQDTQFKELIQVAFECGPRPQEILRVEAKDVDTDLKAWVFERTNSKGKKRRTTVFLNDTAWKITKRRMKAFPEGPLFRNSEGEPWTPFSVSNRFDRMKKHIGRKYCLYHLRHSFCHHALKSHVDPVTLSKLMNHVDSAMISRVYSHLLHDPEYMRKSLAKVSS